MSRRAIVVGGGIAGLAAAHRLAERGVAVTLYEASEEVGGLGGTFTWRGRPVERFYHCTMASDDDLLALADAAGVRRDYTWARTTMGMVVAGRHYDFNTAKDLLTFTPLTLPQRLRLGAGGLLLRLLGRGRDLDNLTARSWLEPIFGRRVYERIWRPLFAFKFGPAGDDVPAYYLWARAGREGNVAVRGYPPGGYRGLAEAIARAVRARGGEIVTGTPVRAITWEGGPTATVDTGADRQEAELVVSTLPIPLLREVAAGRLREPARTLRDVPYQGVVNAVFLLRRSVTRHYWTPVLESGAEFDGVVEMSALTGTEVYGGFHAVYVMRYCHRDAPEYDSSPGLLERWRVQLRDLFGLADADFEDGFVHKAPYVEPVYPLGYRRGKPPHRLADSPVRLATSAQVYPAVTSWNSSTGMARRVVDEALAEGG